MGGTIRTLLACGAAAGVLVWAGVADAQTRRFDIPAEAASKAVPEFARQAGVQIVVAGSQIAGLTTSEVRGELAPRVALARLLAGSGLTVVDDSGPVVTLRRGEAAGPQSTAAEPSVPADQTAAVSEVVVTANKRAQRLQDVPASITAETGADLQHRGATQLEDVIRNTPGLSNPGSGGGNATNLTIRNVTTGADLGLKQSTVSLLFDDIPVDPATSSLVTTNLRTIDIERVEVLRGPQGTLFGSGSLSGAVRFITNKPDFQRYEGAVEVTGAGTQNGAGSVWGDAVVNVPVIVDKLVVRAVGYGFDEGGWVDNLNTGRKDANGNDTKGGRLEIAARPTERLSVNLTGAYQDSEDASTGESLYTPPAGTSDDSQATTIRQSPNTDVVSKLLNLGVRYDLDAVSLFSSTTYIRREASQVSSVDYYNDILSAVLRIPPLAGNPASNASVANQNIFTQEVRASSRGTGPLKWTVGAFYLDADSKTTQVVASPALAQFIGSGNLGTLGNSGYQKEVSGFGEATYTLAQVWDFTAGLRVSYTTLRTDTVSSGLLLTGTPDPTVLTRSSIAQHETTADPRFSLAYRPNTDLTLYATASRGYRVGGPNLGAGLGGPGVPTSYGSDSLWNYELGVKDRLFGGRLQLSGAGYYIDWSDIQVSLAKNGVGYTDNAGAARVYGFELEGIGKPAPWFDVGGSLSLSHGELTKDLPTFTRISGGLGVKSGDRLPASPEVQLSLFAEARFKVLARDAYVRATERYTGDEYTDFGEAGTRFGDFDTLDLRAGVQLDRVELAVFLNNVTDSQGARGAGDAQSYAGVLPIAPQLAYRIRPRTVGVTVRARF